MSSPNSANGNKNGLSAMYSTRRSIRLRRTTNRARCNENCVCLFLLSRDQEANQEEARISPSWFPSWSYSGHILVPFCFSRPTIRYNVNEERCQRKGMFDMRCFPPRKRKRGSTEMRKRKTSVAPAQPATPPQLLSIPEVAKTLSIGRTKVYGLIREEGLPSVKVGSMMRVSVVDLQKWVEEHTQRAS